ncbi:hypothetical protein BBO99_00000226 [Phytophthora kernoviae]|uniref:L-2-hydroxyglutarate dehydrogenase, mitochondrial n=2 Tax=Phytophthora kernoviae TaxID=325452 RepID=A0A3R7G1J0_9STRA|nr:hypothetical protein G195_002387 [Phytophthora kernoviae 00238/432]KAG2530661.1 hypothetical protein JM16_001500 [Phytophthora kernoviae]KAG2530868.1 hypothetical protein JM18_001330 [Phytophthora kernoviae]RLN21388.1 hypothetical protein BBI17_000364 [Phytophthora kernoviae]RLN85674.1 hypothetical protein BBO99_00000226 [Phytophthora kernoviae]
MADVPTDTLLVVPQRLPLSKKQQRKQDKARWLAERKAKQVAEGLASSKRKRRNQRQSRVALVDTSARPSPTVHYENCTSTTCANRAVGSCVIRTVSPYVHHFALFAKGRWAGRSLRDLFAAEFPTLSASYCTQAARLGLVRLNGESAALDSIINEGDFLEHLKHRHEPSVHLPVSNTSPPSSLSTTWIHFETDDIMVVDKPSGLPVHPTGSYQFNSLTCTLQHDRSEVAKGKLEAEEGAQDAAEMPLELFPVHRLDRLTSGLLLLGKTSSKARSLTAELTATSSPIGDSTASRSVKKFYVARIQGEFPESIEGFVDVEGVNSGLVKIDSAGDGFWRVTAPIGMMSPRQGHTRCVIDATDSKPCVTLIRVHLQHLGFPIVNDPLYGSVKSLAVARAAACRGLEVLLLEKNALVGQETSSRNSEVVHAGIYYAKDSWKARLCVQGRDQLYDFCREFGVPFSQCGKLIVAQSHQSEQLRSILKRGLRNGVKDLRLLSQSEARAIEPQVACQEAVFSPSTGIVDSHALMLALQGDAENHGAVVARATTVQGGRYDAKSKMFVIQATQSGEGGEGEEMQEVECNYFVNSTGMFAPNLLDKIVAPEIDLPARLPRVPDRFAKGTYFKLGSNHQPFSRLVYPIPEVGGLGVHATVDLAGNVRFGPDVEWINEIEYQPDPSKAETFAERIRAYWPEAHAELLEAGYCGIRPKIEVDGSIFDDFYIADKLTHSVPGLVHLCGIESPGLTASLAIADTVVAMLHSKD